MHLNIIQVVRFSPPTLFSIMQIEKGISLVIFVSVETVFDLLQFVDRDPNYGFGENRTFLICSY